MPRFLGMSHTLEMMLSGDPKAYEALYEGVVAYSAALTPSCSSTALLDTMDEEHKAALFDMVRVWCLDGGGVVMVGRGVCYDGGVVLWWAGVYVMMRGWCYGGQGCML